MAGSSERSSQELEYCTTSETMPSLFFSCVEEQIEESKAHWSDLADEPSSECMAEDEAEVSNVKEFLELQRHPTLGGFFAIFGDHVKGRFLSMGSLEVGEKFAEGKQAELFHAKVTWGDPRYNEKDLKNGAEHALKVFKKGTYLKDLKLMLPHGLLQVHAMTMKHFQSPTAKSFPRFTCSVLRGTLLEDGRFAFLMKKEHLDLRTLIECNMKLRGGEVHGPFSNEQAELMMFDVALGVNRLHNHGIVHRDLKASNVLVQKSTLIWRKWICYVADYECSVGVVGTGFFRAPEILQVSRERKISDRPEVFSTRADVYSYGMTCYEILTGKLPFEDHPLIPDNNSLLVDLVINQGLRPEVPENVEEWVVDLLKRCWQHDPTDRPTFEEILNVHLANSATARRLEDSFKLDFGEHYRIGLHSEIDEKVLFGNV